MGCEETAFMTEETEKKLYRVCEGYFILWNYFVFLVCQRNHLFLDGF